MTAAHAPLRAGHGAYEGYVRTSSREEDVFAGWTRSDTRRGQNTLLLRGPGSWRVSYQTRLRYRTRGGSREWNGMFDHLNPNRLMWRGPERLYTFRT